MSVTDDNIVEFPGRVPPPEGYSEQFIDKLHSEAFRDLEGSLGDCVTMAVIAMRMVECAVGDGRDQKHENAMFAVFHVTKMLKDLKVDYYARWNGERRGSR
jgi:hypothetical protein